jgi:hypothetical protein
MTAQPPNLPPLPGALAWSGQLVGTPQMARAGVDEQIHVAQGALLPMCCVKCGARQPLVPRDVTFVWTPPWIWAFLPLGVLIPVVLSAVLTRRARLRLPLCESCNRRWSTGVLIGVATALGLVGGLVGGIALMVNDLVPAGLALLCTGVLAPFLIGPLVTRPRFLRAKRIDERGWITIAGMHADARTALLEHETARTAPAAAPSSGAIQQPT